MGIIMRFPGGLSKALTLSYDDGVAQDIRLVGIMAKHGLKGTFNINTGTIAKKDAVGGGRMSDAQLIPLYRDSGNEVAVHTYTHPHLEAMSAVQITEEVLRDRAEIEKRFGKITRGMAYPYGSYNDTVVDCLKACGIVYSRTTVSTGSFGIPTDWLRMPATCHHNDGRLMTLCEKFTTTEPRPHDQPWLFYLWGHSYEFDNNDNWNVIEEFAEKIGGREDVWYATNIEVYDYVKAYEAIRFSIDKKTAENPTSIDVYCMVDGKAVKIPAGSTITI
ncbi:MAG: polysaccharide deacetylase family protein [Clostridia bacterium]|nr:polysaccharide deacetylase family protein [Clostridia bacterium]